MKVSVPYYTESIACEVPDSRYLGCLQPKALPPMTLAQQREAIARALAQPIDSPPLSRLAQGKENILLITSDHTRPMPSGLTLPMLLKGLRGGAPRAHIKILIATGFHRLTTEAEYTARFGPELAGADIIVHDSRDAAQMVYKGIMPSGGELWLNGLVDWADLIVSEGFIEPHFFAGFSGGRKSILPGIASEKTVFFNHNAAFIADDKARNGILDGNPIHRDMAFACRQTGLAFILNVCSNEHKQVARAFAGHPINAHLQGCDFVAAQARAEAVEADIVITSNGGFPLDQNIYQSVKCMSGAEPCVRPGGVIIAFGSCVEGHGSEGFYQLFLDHKTPALVEAAILARGRENTLPDQWQAQVLARVMQKASIILVTSHCDHGLVKDFGLIPAKDFAEAMTLAEGIVGREAKILFMPNGVEVMAVSAD